MSIQINKESYQKLIKEDIEWLLKNTERDLERDHIIDVLLNSIDDKYPYEDSYDEEFKKWKYDTISKPILDIALEVANKCIGIDIEPTKFEDIPTKLEEFVNKCIKNSPELFPNIDGVNIDTNGWEIIATPIHKEYTDDWDWDDTKCCQCRHFDGYDVCMEEGQFGTVNTIGLNRCLKKNLFKQNI